MSNLEKTPKNIFNFHSNPKSEVKDGVFEFFNHNKNLVIIFTGYRQGLGPIDVQKTVKMFQNNNFDIIFLQDIKNMWYHMGIPPYGQSIDDIISALKNKSRSYEKVITLGSSMGGYMAILVGKLINANYCIGFSSNSFIDKASREKYGDKDRIEQKDEVCRRTQTPHYLNLKKYFEENRIDAKTCCFLFCGEFNKKDMAHTTEISYIDNVHLFTNKTSEHGLEKSLVKSNMLGRLIKKISDNKYNQELILFLKNENNVTYHQNL